MLTLLPRHPLLLLPDLSSAASAKAQMGITVFMFLQPHLRQRHPITTWPQRFLTSGQQVVRLHCKSKLTEPGKLMSGGRRIHRHRQAQPSTYTQITATTRFTTQIWTVLSAGGTPSL